MMYMCQYCGIKTNKLERYQGKDVCPYCYDPRVEKVRGTYNTNPFGYPVEEPSKPVRIDDDGYYFY